MLANPEVLLRARRTFARLVAWCAAAVVVEEEPILATPGEAPPQPAASSRQGGEISLAGSAIAMSGARSPRLVAGACATAACGVAIALSACAAGAVVTRHAAPGSTPRAATAAANCRPAPALRGLTLAAARLKAARAGCRLSVSNPGSQDDALRVVASQAARRGPRGSTIDLRLGPLCMTLRSPGPPPHEPLIKSGPTELVSGLFLAGGPVSLYSAARCWSFVGTPSAGTITLTDRATGARVAKQTVAEGQLAQFRLAPGSYTITGTFADAVAGGVPLTTPAQTVDIPQGDTVRQDVVASIP